MANYSINSLASAYKALRASPPALQTSKATKRAYQALKKAASGKSNAAKAIASDLKQLEAMGDFERDKSAYYQTAYSSLKNAYRNKAKEDMINAGAAATENTGGFGNSYAATAASRAYGAQMSALADQLPALYNAASEEHANRKNALASLIELRGEQRDSEIDRAKLMLNAERALDKQRYASRKYADKVKRANAERFLARYYGQ